MTKRKLRACLVVLLCWLCAAAAGPAGAEPVLMISIDGLRPDYVLQADAHHLQIPTLRLFLKLGAYAQGVVGVIPTVTYPSHTTLVTGVWPAEHGIYGNVTSDTLRRTTDTWYWYARDVKVPTLWDAAAQAGMVTASVSWPVTVGRDSVKYLIPEYWYTRTPTDVPLMEALSRPDGWLRAAEQKLGPYNEDSVEAVQGDEVRTKFSLEILATEKPAFMTIHLAALDHYEHATGPFSAKSDATLEALDGMVSRLIAAARANDPTAAIAIVSDHGFLPVERDVNLLLPFLQAGLIKLKPAVHSWDAPKIASWDAMFWPAGGSAAVVLRDKNDAAMAARVKSTLEKMKEDMQFQIARIIEQPQLTQMGGFPDAAFLVEMKPGAEPAWAVQGDISVASAQKGTHGYLPDRPELRASFFIMGPHVAVGRDLGVIDMRQIAPTIAGILGVSLPTAKAQKLAISQ